MALDGKGRGPLRRQHRSSCTPRRLPMGLRRSDLQHESSDGAVGRRSRLPECQVLGEQTAHLGGAHRDPGYNDDADVSEEGFDDDNIVDIGMPVPLLFDDDEAGSAAMMRPVVMVRKSIISHATTRWY